MLCSGPGRILKLLAQVFPAQLTTSDPGLHFADISYGMRNEHYKRSGLLECFRLLGWPTMLLASFGKIFN